ncbi:MAG: tRNA-uridine 2-sulfurtransferase [Patescibacteria group bacterium]|jgi:tRNA-specific 2-thiouridylase|nr:tRNA-uridine 2-sulfurtransferase [Patescibacteria group bacterium]
MKNEQQTVYVGLSGGVDSSVAAALLIEQGYRVVGAYMKNWTQDIAGNPCPWEDDLRSAKSVAAHLGIELKIFDLQTQYKERVVDAMVQAYAAGLTPNPDVLCNEEIKFSLFYDLCREAGADFVATGHYARILDGRLTQAIDKKKDQTYFLYRMPIVSAQRVLFPLGEYEKPQVRELAAERKLPTATRRESMGLCFVGKIPLKDFLGEFMELEPGPIFDEAGKELGRHDGAALYTVGQRHGLGVGGGTPFYVLSRDLKANSVTVTADPSQLKKSHYDIGGATWWMQPENDASYQVRIRHLGELLNCKLEEKVEGNWRIHLIDGAHRGVAAGQHAVIYDGDFVLGGGVIQ